MDNNQKNYWNLDSLFTSDDDPKIEEEKRIVKQKNYKFVNKWKDRDDYLNEPAILEEALNEYEQLCSLYGTTGNFGYYFWLRFSQDQDNPVLKARKNKLDDFSQKILNELRFFILRIAKIPEKKQKEFLKFIGLNKYKHFLEKTFARSKYLLSEKEENILSLESKAGFSNWVDMVSNFISKEEAMVVSKKGKDEIKNFSEILSLISSKDKKVRDSASQVLNGIFNKYSEVAEHEINSILHFKKVEDELREMKRPDLERHLDDDISSEVVDILIDSVSNRFDLSQKYYGLKSKLLGVEKLRYHERNVPYGKIDKKYSYKESIEIVLRVLKNLDQRFFEICEGFIKNGQIDSHSKKGKMGGAFCAHDLIIQPTYILLNHADKLSDVLTIAHEVGHGINN